MPPLFLDRERVLRTHRSLIAESRRAQGMRDLAHVSALLPRLR
jgi:hypothetical protein